MAAESETLSNGETDISDDDFEKNIEETNEDEDEDNYVKYNIMSYPSDLTLEVIIKQFRDKEIYVPPYQREFVWDIKQASRLIDSFLSGLPVPPIFLYVEDDNKASIIDGQQRVLSIYYFIHEGYFGRANINDKRTVFKLKGLGKMAPYEGKTFVELDPDDQRKLRNSVLRAINIIQRSPDDDKSSVYSIFERLNTGGTKLKPQEIRNCIYYGELNNKLKELNKDPNWRKLIGQNAIHKNMVDVEMILRIFALYGNEAVYEKPLKDFLNKTMGKHRTGGTNRCIYFFEKFVDVASLLSSRLGEKPFHVRGPLNMATLEAIMCVAVEHFLDIDVDNLQANYTGLLENEKFKEYTLRGTSNVDAVRGRSALVKQYLLKQQ